MNWRVSCNLCLKQQFHHANQPHDDDNTRLIISFISLFFSNTFRSRVFFRIFVRFGLSFGIWNLLTFVDYNALRRWNIAFYLYMNGRLNHYESSIQNIKIQYKIRHFAFTSFILSIHCKWLWHQVESNTIHRRCY